MPTYNRHSSRFTPFVVDGDEWIRWVAVCRTESNEPDDPFCESEVHYIDVVCEYATETSPDPFGIIHRSWHRDDPLSRVQEDWFARRALQKLQDGTAYVEVPA